MDLKVTELKLNEWITLLREQNKKMVAMELGEIKSLFSEEKQR